MNDETAMRRVAVVALGALSLLVALARLVGHCAAVGLAAIGATTMGLLVYGPFWDGLPDGSASRTYAVSLASVVVAIGAAVGLVSRPLLPRGPARTPARAIRADGTFSLRMAARHEAAHGLVAAVLGVPFCGVRVLPASGAVPEGRAGGGWVDLGCPPPAATAEDLYSLAVRKLAVAAAGAVGARGGRPLAEAIGDPAAAKDWCEARELSWLMAALRPDRDLWWDVARAVHADLDAQGWQAAIEAAARCLVRARGGVVAPEVFAGIASRFGLRMDAVEACSSAGIPANEPCARRAIGGVEHARSRADGGRKGVMTAPDDVARRGGCPGEPGLGRHRHARL